MFGCNFLLTSSIIILLLFENQMSIISSKSGREREGFTPYQSDQELNDKEISLLSKLNLNDQQSPLEQYPKCEILFNDKYSCDLRSVGSKKRKLSEEFINVNASKIGRNTFLNRSLIGKSSLDSSFMHEIQFGDSHDHGLQEVSLKKQLSENSCPANLNNQQRQQIFFEEVTAEKPRFTKTKNLLRNLSNYMHKFIMYSKRGERWVREYFQRQMLRQYKRKESEEVSVSNKSSDLSCFQDMCKIEDTIKMEETPKMEPSMIHCHLPSKDDSDHLLKESLELSEKEFLMKDEKVEQSKVKLEEGRDLSQLEINQKIKQFQIWVSQLSIANFSDYEAVWTKPHKFRGIYRVFCYKYYRSEAFCDIYRSRLTTKHISACYLHQFIQGMLQPSQFYRFK